MPSKQVMTKKKKTFCREILKPDVTPTDAARTAGYSENGIHQTAHRLMHRDNQIREYLFAEMEKVGITDPYVAEKMREGMTAMTKPVKEGGKRYEDYFVRKQYVDMYFRLKGLYSPEKSEHVEKVIHLHITPQLIEGLKDSGKITEQQAEVLDAEIIREG